MTQSQAAQLRRMCPKEEEKIWPIKQYAGFREGDVQDPYGGSLEQYQSCAAELELLCVLILDQLEKR